MRATYKSFPLPEAPVLTPGRTFSPPSVDDVAEALKAVSVDSVIEVVKASKGDSCVIINPPRLREIVAFLRGDPRFGCKMLSVISAVDYPAQEDKPEIPARIEVVYVLSSHAHRFQVLLKAKLDRDHPRIDSITDFYRAANWYERECFDMLGVWFDGHPNLERILLPPDWVGHPLRKDYVFPEEYNGMKVPL